MFARLWNLLRYRRLDREMDAELSHHLESLEAQDGRDLGSDELVVLDHENACRQGHQTRYRPERPGS